MSDNGNGLTEAMAGVWDELIVALNLVVQEIQDRHLEDAEVQGHHHDAEETRHTAVLHPDEESIHTYRLAERAAGKAAVEDHLHDPFRAQYLGLYPPRHHYHGRRHPVESVVAGSLGLDLGLGLGLDPPPGRAGENADGHLVDHSPGAVANEVEAEAGAEGGREDDGGLFHGTSQLPSGGVTHLQARQTQSIGNQRGLPYDLDTKAGLYSLA